MRWDSGQTDPEVGLSGWRVIRPGPGQITKPILERLAAVTNEPSHENRCGEEPIFCS